MRKVKGKKKPVDKSKLYTWKECRDIAVKMATDSVKNISATVLNIAIMTYIDMGNEDANEFTLLMQKYIDDYSRGEFKDRDLERYINEELRQQVEGLVESRSLS